MPGVNLNTRPEADMFSASQQVSLSFRQFGFLAALVIAGTLSLFAVDGTQPPLHGQSELACAKAKLEAMWEVELPEGPVGSVPSRAVSADWDLKELGCPGAIHPTATLDEIFAGSFADFSYTAAIPSARP
jgi:hypothetical protein